MGEEIEGGDGSEPPIENTHDPELHPLHRFGLEDELGLEDLEVQDERDVRLLHFRG